MENEKKLQEVFVESLGLSRDSDLDFESLAYRRIDKWDSVAHMQLVGDLESAFDIMLETQDVIDLSTYPKARQILTKYGLGF